MKAYRVNASKLACETEIREGGGGGRERERERERRGTLEEKR